MSDNYIMIDGEKYELNKEQYEKFKEEFIPRDPFKREHNERYFYIGSAGPGCCANGTTCFTGAVKPFAVEIL
jgi:hypothetical protein